MHNKNAQYSPPDINDTRNLWVFMVYIAAFPPKNDDMSRTAMIQKPTPLHLIVSLLIKIAIMAVAVIVRIAVMLKDIPKPTGTETASPCFTFMPFPPPLFCLSYEGDIKKEPEQCVPVQIYSVKPQRQQRYFCAAPVLQLQRGTSFGFLELR